MELRPPVLYELGLAAALNWLADQMKTDLGLTVEVQADAAAEPTSDDMRAFLYQSARELLFNVSKHAGVKAARVRVGGDGADNLRIEVSDRGAGFDVSASKPISLGLFNIRERAAHFGGRMETRSEQGQGTCVTITLPLSTGSRSS